MDVVVIVVVVVDVYVVVCDDYGFDVVVDCVVLVIEC